MKEKTKIIIILLSSVIGVLLVIPLIVNGLFMIEAPCKLFAVKWYVSDALSYIAGSLAFLGTSFLVRELQTQMEVQVLQGRVRMEAGKKQPVLLEAGMSARYSETDEDLQVLQEADENCLSWKTGELVFRETPLSKVIHDIEVCYEVKLKDLSGASDSLRLSASFKKKPVEEVLLVINQTLDTQLVIEKSKR